MFKSVQPWGIRFLSTPARFFFEFEKPTFYSKPAGKTAELSVGVDDAMAGNENGNRILSASAAHRAEAVGMADVPRDRPITACLSMGNSSERSPDLLLERGAFKQVDFCIEPDRATCKISPHPGHKVREMPITADGGTTIVPLEYFPKSRLTGRIQRDATDAARC